MGSHCSDLQELIGGQPWVLVRMPAAADATADNSKLSGADKVWGLVSVGFDPSCPVLTQ